jgi:hypothetical protein
MISPYRVLKARAQARALLWYAGDYPDRRSAVMPLFAAAEQQGLVDQVGAEAIEAIVKAAFDVVSEK